MRLTTPGVLTGFSTLTVAVTAGLLLSNFTKVDDSDFYKQPHQSAYRSAGDETEAIAALPSPQPLGYQSATSSPNYLSAPVNSGMVRDDPGTASDPYADSGAARPESLSSRTRQETRVWRQGLEDKDDQGPVPDTDEGARFADDQPPAASTATNDGTKEAEE